MNEKRRQRSTRKTQDESMKHLNVEASPPFNQSDNNNSNKGKKKRSLLLLLHDMITNNTRRVLLGLVTGIILYFIHVSFSHVKLAKVYKESAMIQNNYADIKGLDDLEQRSKDNLDDYCYVS